MDDAKKYNRREAREQRARVNIFCVRCHGAVGWDIVNRVWVCFHCGHTPTRSEVDQGKAIDLELAEQDQD